VKITESGPNGRIAANAAAPAPPVLRFQIAVNVAEEKRRRTRGKSVF
jgi:hypothetical protein